MQVGSGVVTTLPRPSLDKSDNMTENTAQKEEITRAFTKLDATYTIRISKEDEDLFEQYRWSLMVGRNGHVALHRTEKRKKIYFSRSVLERKLGYKLEKGESCVHIDCDSTNKTRDNLALKVSKKLTQARAALKVSE